LELIFYFFSGTQFEEEEDIAVGLVLTGAISRQVQRLYDELALVWRGK
jgi:hypothetical protein